MSETIGALKDALNSHVKEIAENYLSERISELKTVGPPPDIMTAKELAIYWRMINDAGEPITSSLYKWMRRPMSEHPLPHVSMGELVRFRRAEVDRWAEEEAVRNRQKSIKEVA